MLPEKVREGIKNGTVMTGSLRINKRNRMEGYITSDDREQDILIPGSRFRNRALEGDVVAVILLTGEELEREKSRIMEDKEKKQLESEARTKRVRGHANFGDESDTTETDDSEPDEIGLEEALAKLTLEVRDLPLGKIVSIIERRHHGYAGTLMLSFPVGKGRVPSPKVTEIPNLIWFKPIDKRVPFIALPVEDVPKEDLHALLKDADALAKDMFTAEITRWGVTNKNPFGRLLGRLGMMGELQTETAALLVDNDVRNQPFSEAVLECLPATPWKIPDAEIDQRRDFREEQIFTIDPPTAKDLDDAVHCKLLDDGLIEIGVHIADVSYFVPEGSALDDEAKLRATTVYLVQKAIPMLPSLLCEELCSLNPGVDRLAFSVVWKMTRELEVKDVWFGRSVIRSCGKLAYDHAQDFIEGRGWEYRRKHANEEVDVGVKLLPPPELSNGYTEDNIRDSTMLLYEISVKLRKARFERGALSMNNIKLWFALDHEGNPINTGVYEQKEANKLIEEFMLLANMAVAKRIAGAFPKTALLRRHPIPNKRQMDKFLELVMKLGYPMDASTSGSLQASFDAIEDDEVQQTLRLLCIKPMQRAKYFCTNDLEESQWGHYALNVPLYTHFTSPIRRFADLVVHRTLEEALKSEPCSCSAEMCKDIADNCNKRKGNILTPQVS
jgi:protein SSD1